VYHCRWKLDWAVLQEAAAQVIGEHDFTSLAAADGDLTSRSSPEQDGMPVSNVRTIFSSQWSEAGADRIVYRVRGSGFLHHMVRNLVGTMIEIARGQFPAGSMPLILQAQARSAGGPTAPARGLFLHSVEYDEPSSYGEASIPC
jgi:tRNA pseudouridine38-40 synthase